MQSMVDVENAPTVYLVDDDLTFSNWLVALLESINLPVQAFSTPSAFLDKFDPAQAGCVILDVRLPEMSGLELQRRLADRQVQTPIVIITAYGEVSMAVEALKAGAVDFIQKPSSAQSLLERIQRALEVGRDRRDESSLLANIRGRLASLSPRELEVLELLVAGKTTKEIASSLHIGMTTVDFHRNNLLEKMDADNVVKLTRLMYLYEQLCLLARE